MRSIPGWQLERSLWDRGLAPVAGIDEAGRGALAGPVVAACVILPVGDWPFVDSKTVDAATRARLAARVRAVALAWSVGEASAVEIDEINVLEATRLAARRALERLRIVPAALTTDYLNIGAGLPEVAVAHGDSRSLQIAAASLLAKTVRDARMRQLERRFPGYGFGRHKGYGVPSHLAALDRMGVCAVHRRTFAPVARALTSAPAYNGATEAGAPA